jgi:ubiquinone/menaquinone biosynthesis C-methylase UbiE/uncharacterized protein YbaR (Trm112 family)
MIKESLNKINKLKQIYAKGGNIISYLRDLKNGESENSIEDIILSYEFQSGSYIRGFDADPSFRIMYNEKIGSAINKLGEFSSILEVGTGEAINLGLLIANLKYRPSYVAGFDISWSRLKYARNFLKRFPPPVAHQYSDYELFVADMFNIPLSDNAIDIVFTSHSIESNGGREREALQELYRITNKYLILLEPSYELANEESRARMKKYGYITNLLETAKQLHYDIIEYRLFDCTANPINPTGLMIIEKNGNDIDNTKLVCPLSHTKLIEHNSFLYSPESCLAYPVLDNIPVLLQDNAILAVHL